MATKNVTPDVIDQLAELEARVQSLENALHTEQQKTAEMQRLIDSQSSGLEQSIAGYDKAFEHASRSYEIVLQRALDMTGKRVIDRPITSPSKSNKGTTTTIITHVADIFDDLPKVLASFALVVSLFTGGTSLISLFQSSLAREQVQIVTDVVHMVEGEATEAKVEAQEAKNDATNAKLEAVEAKAEASSAKEDATEAKQEAQEAKDDASVAKEDATEAKVNAEQAIQEVEKVTETAP